MVVFVFWTVNQQDVKTVLWLRYVLLTPDTQIDSHQRKMPARQRTVRGKLLLDGCI